MTDTGDIIQEAINLEIFGYYFYNSLKEVIDSDQGKSLLTFLADAEKEHQVTLEELMVKTGGEIRSTNVDEIVAEISKNEGIESVFNKLLGMNTLEKMDAIEAVKIGINVEQKSIDFYSLHAETSDNPDIKETFNTFTDIEKKHKEVLEENLNNLENEGVWYGYVPILEG
jgi:rubrerythrin